MTLTRTNAAVELGHGAGQLAHTEGHQCVASGTYAHAEGFSCGATGQAAHAQGYQSLASGIAAHAEGHSGVASGNYSHAQGRSATASRIGQFAHGSNPPSNIAATVAQHSAFTLGGQVAAAAGSTMELTFIGNGTISAAAVNASVLTVPLKSVVLVRYDIVARPNANAAAGVLGAYWTGTVMVGRGNDAATLNAQYSTGAQQANTALVTLPQTASFDAAAANLQLRYAINGADATYNFLSFSALNNSGMAYSLVGSLQCVELVTTT